MEEPYINWVMEKSEHFFTIAFALELLIKVIAQGLIIDKNCYLRDAWNWLDAIVVIGSILSYLPDIQNVTVLRTFRLFKPLRSLKQLPQMKELVIALLESINLLTNIFFLLAFILLLFSILATQMWSGRTNFRCRQTLSPVDGDWPTVPGDFQICGGMHQCNEALNQTCGSLFQPELRE